MIGMVISPAMIILLTFFFWWSSLVGPLALGLALHFYLQETISKNLSFWYSFLVGLLRGFTGNISKVAVRIKTGALLSFSKLTGATVSKKC